MTNNRNNRPALAITAGGKSRRMGRDKAELELGGASLLDRMIDEALIAADKQLADTVVVVGRTGTREDVTWLEDDESGLGPLGGLKTVLGHLGRPVLLVACDMPLVDAEALGWLLDEFRISTGEHGLATMRDGQLEPLFSVYRPAVLDLVEERISAGRLSARRLIEDGEFRRVEAPGEVAGKLANVNRPEELEAIRKLMG
ncbi:MAG: molybdenum cofactor guanylyltransferase [Persicimonas sp.]